jgi:hypothetical protein
LTYSSRGGLLPLAASSSLHAALLTADLSALLHLGKYSGGLGPPKSELQLHVRAPVDGLDGAVRGSGWLKRLGGEEALRYLAAVVSGAVGGDGYVSAAGRGRSAWPAASAESPCSGGPPSRPTALGLR